MLLIADQKGYVKKEKNIYTSFYFSILKVPFTFTT